MAGHHGKMGGHQARRGQPRHRSHGPGGHRHHAQGTGHRSEAGLRENRISRWPATLLIAFFAPCPGDAASATFVEANQRHLQGAGQFLGVNALAQARHVGRSPLQGEILPSHHAGAAFDFPCAQHEVGWRESGQLARLVHLRHPRRRPLLTKTVRVQQAADALANGEPALGMLLGDGLLAALGLGQRLPLADFFHFLFPTHRMSFPFVFMAVIDCAGPRQGAMAQRTVKASKDCADTAV